MVGTSTPSFSQTLKFRTILIVAFGEMSCDPVYLLFREFPVGDLDDVLFPLVLARDIGGNRKRLLRCPCDPENLYYV